MGRRQLDVRRLSLAAKLFRSPFDGEKLAALEAADRLLRAADTTWDDILAAPAPARARAAAKVDRRTPQEIAADLAREAADSLTEWEVNFLQSLQWFRSPLSIKQLARLAEIRGKVEAMGAGA